MVVYYLDQTKPIKQGDIFKNIPYLSFDLLVKSRREDKLDSLENENIDIFEEITQEGKPILIETFISSTLCILASQDCDILNEDSLIFYPLVEYKNHDSVNKIVEEIRDTTRSLYLPRIKVDKEREFGPFTIEFREPIKIPKVLLKGKLKVLRIAQIFESVRKIFIGKLNNFYSRLPIEETIFLECDEIQKYIVNKWKEFKNKPNEMEKICSNIKYNLEECNRTEDISNLFFDKPVNHEGIKEIMRNMLNLNFGKKLPKEYRDINALCNEILSYGEISFDNLKNQKNKYSLLKKNLENLKIRINTEEFIKDFLKKKSEINDRKIINKADGALNFFKTLKL